MFTYFYVLVRTLYVLLRLFAYLLLCIHKRSFVYTQKNLLCIHKRSLVHAHHSCAVDRALFGSLAPGFRGPEHAQEISCACTRDSLVYTQENLLCIHKRMVRCMYADVGCMSMKRLGACMWNWVHVCWVHVCGVGCMSMRRLGACMPLMGASWCH